MDLLAQIFGATALILNFAFPVDAKYCTYDVEGELRYYICPRNEYCCNFGCCLSPTFQFYQLWYYWLMVIFMFLLCSGGGWWYRYWLQGRYGPELGTSMPPPSSRIHSHHLSHRPARVSYHPSRDAVVLHHIWKPRGLGTGSAFPHASPPPSYACAQRAASVSLPHDSSQTTSGMSNVINTLGPKMSPYYQLYGPPPPYETVINQQPEVHQNTSSDVNSSISEPQLSLPPDVNSSDSAACAAATTSSVCNTAVTINSTNSNDSSNVPAHGEQPVQDSNTSIKNIV